VTSRHLASYLIEAADRWGARPACADASGTQTYADYLRESFRLAALLRSCGVAAGDRVCISVPKSFALYASIFGTIFANACYVPIDYTTPAERGRKIMRDCAAAALITTRQNLKRLLGGLPAEGGEDVAGDDLVIAAFDRDAADGSSMGAMLEWSADPSEPLSEVDTRDPSSPAYILYTSGSTGEPKGVVQSHRSAGAFVEWAVDELKIGSDDVIPQVASVSFDLSVFDIFGAVRTGALLVPIHESVMVSPVTFCRAVARAGATVLYCVPSLVLREARSQLLGWAELEKSELRHLVFAGEPINKQALRRLRPCVADVALHNWYGPTETNVCCFHRITDRDIAGDESIPIGRPCPYTRLTFVWDAAQGPGPRAGELLVAGGTVMSGYWNRQGETDRAMLAGDNGETYYRTGDFVYLNDRQDLVFLGRRDRQVKVHGRRVQLDEIEVTLQKHLSNSEIACILIKPDGRDPVVVAAIVGEATPDADHIRTVVADHLPLFMMPERIFAIDALPRNERGKIDYASLARILSEEYQRA
jgi:amino acid adenylation domain-containing protein